MDTLTTFLNSFLPEGLSAFIVIMLKIVAILLPLILAVAYTTFAERKVIGYMQSRMGPNRVGPKGWLQPIADTVKLMFKEIITPTEASKIVFFIAPMLALAPALAVWSVIPFWDGGVLANVNAGLLLILAVNSLDVFGIILSSNDTNLCFEEM